MWEVAIIYGFINSVILALTALGFSLTFGISGVPNFAYGAMYIFAGFVSWLLLNKLAIPFFASALMAIVFTAILGAAMYRFVLLRVRG
ncbi:MAG: branched-chain amino acid ABC transporter permease, partial [Desulfomonilaceae bacterium]